jgi:hypothetical protein
MAKLWQAPTGNFFQTTLSGAITSGQGTITLNSTTGLQYPGYIVVDRVDSNGNSTAANREVVTFTGISGQNLTGCVRGADQGSGKNHNDAAVVESCPTVGMWNDLITIWNTGFDTNGMLNSVISPVSIAYAQITQANIVSAASIAMEYISRSFISNLTISNSFNASGASITGLFPSGASGAILTSSGNSIIPVFATPSTGTSGADGWTSTSDAWTYASASTINVPSGAAAIYCKGDRIKWTQTTVKYGVIVAVADTLLTIAVNTDYVVTNAAISAISYSHQASPVGFPQWFTIVAPTFDVSTLDNGSGGQPTIAKARLKVDGTTCTIHLDGSGTKATTNNYWTCGYTNWPTMANTSDRACFGTAYTFTGGSTDIGGAITKASTNMVFIFTSSITDNVVITGFGGIIIYEI